MILRECNISSHVFIRFSDYADSLFFFSKFKIFKLLPRWTTRKTLYHCPAERSWGLLLFSLWLFILIHIYTCACTCISTMTTTSKRLIPIGWFKFCIIGVHILLNLIIYYMRTLPRARSPTSPAEDNSNFAQAWMSSPLSYTFTSFRSYSQGFTSSWYTKKGKNTSLLERLKIYV